PPVAGFQGRLRDHVRIELRTRGPLLHHLCSFADAPACEHLGAVFSHDRAALQPDPEARRWAETGHGSVAVPKGAEEGGRPKCQPKDGARESNPAARPTHNRPAPIDGLMDA